VWGFVAWAAAVFRFTIGQRRYKNQQKMTRKRKQQKRIGTVLVLEEGRRTKCLAGLSLPFFHQIMKKKPFVKDHLFIYSIPSQLK